jgi:ectoine hydroxylase-related dioxygenase (phytanoyl-CoA dioxygenase family)
MGIPADLLVSIVFCIDDMDSANGGLVFFSGLHVRLRPDPKGNPLEGDFDREALESVEGCIPETKAGDVIVFHSLVPHKSGANLSED